MKPYIYNDEYIDLGELGEHELQITALFSNDPQGSRDASIMKAVAIIKLGTSVQVLDVTDVIKHESVWIERVTKDHENYKAREWDDIA